MPSQPSSLHKAEVELDKAVTPTATCIFESSAFFCVGTVKSISPNPAILVTAVPTHAMFVVVPSYANVKGFAVTHEKSEATVVFARFLASVSV